MPETQELRTLTCDVTGNPNVCPPTEDYNEGWGATVDQLTKDIGSLLLRRGVPIEPNTSVDEATLHVARAGNATESNVVAELGMQQQTHVVGKLLQLMVTMSTPLLGLILLLVPLGIFQSHELLHRLESSSRHTGIAKMKVTLDAQVLQKNSKE